MPKSKEVEEVIEEVDNWKGQGSFDFDQPDYLGQGFPSAIPTPDEEEVLREEGQKARAAKASQEHSAATETQEVVEESSTDEEVVENE